MLKVLFLLCFSVSAFSDTYVLTQKDPRVKDISIEDLAEYKCSRSGYFNPNVCVDSVMKCYRNLQFPKTIDVHLKLTAFEACYQKNI